MAVLTSNELIHKKCSACEGDMAVVKQDEAKSQLEKLPGWQISQAGKRIRKDWTVKNFKVGLDFFQRVGQLAEADNHHPDLHLEGYRNVWIELSTHAIGGLSENDFILAAKINDLSVELQPAK
jgi:4a-hydroxytetrahydrobiopterin dehydratase